MNLVAVRANIEHESKCERRQKLEVPELCVPVGAIERFEIRAADRKDGLCISPSMAILVVVGQRSYLLESYQELMHVTQFLGRISKSEECFPTLSIDRR